MAVLSGRVRQPRRNHSNVLAAKQSLRLYTPRAAFGVTPQGAMRAAWQSQIRRILDAGTRAGELQAIE